MFDAKKLKREIKCGKSGRGFCILCIITFLHTFFFSYIFNSIHTNIYQQVSATTTATAAVAAGYIRRFRLLLLCQNEEKF